MDSAIAYIPALQITPGKNDRTAFDADALQALACNIDAQGLLQPIILRPIATGYMIVAGERRFRAMTDILHWTSIPALVRSDLTDELASALMLAENTSRADLNPMDEANAYARRMHEFGWTSTYVAQVAGVSQERVARRLRLRTLIDEAQQLVATGHLSLGHAEAMTRLDRNRQFSALRILQSSATALSIPAFQAITQQLYDEQSQDALFALESFWLEHVATPQPLPTRGRRAVTGAPIRTDLPDIAFDIHKDTIGDVFDRYIKQLLVIGKSTEAATLGTIYTFLVHNHRVRVPARASLLTA